MMKIIAMLGAAALAVGAIGAAPADAQRYGYDGHRGGGWHGGGYRGDRGFRDRGYRGHRGGYGYRGNYGYRGHRGYGRSRVVCRVQRGYYGPVRRCFRVGR